MNLRLFVLEPESLRRRLIVESINETPGLTTVGCAASLTQEGVPSGTEPDIFLTSVALLEGENALLADAARQHPGAYFVLFGTHPDLSALLACLDLPVRGYLSFNHLASDEFARSLQVIAYGGAVIEPLSAQLLLEYLRHEPESARGRRSNAALSELTSRENEVLWLVSRGLSNKEIAMRMKISMGTVRAHLRAIFRKLDVTSRTGAAALVIRDRPDPARLAG